MEGEGCPPNVRDALTPLVLHRLLYNRTQGSVYAKKNNIFSFMRQHSKINL